MRDLTKNECMIKVNKLYISRYIDRSFAYILMYRLLISSLYFVKMDTRCELAYTVRYAVCRVPMKRIGGCYYQRILV